MSGPLTIPFGESSCLFIPSWPVTFSDLARNPSLRETRKDILRRALLGLADIHKRDVVHNGTYVHLQQSIPTSSASRADICRPDIKPNNILADYEEGDNNNITANAVQISDLDDAVIVPPGKYLRGPLCGNQMWRSPESWARSAQNQATDLFSFGIVVSLRADEISSFMS